MKAITFSDCLPNEDGRSKASYVCRRGTWKNPASNAWVAYLYVLLSKLYSHIQLLLLVCTELLQISSAVPEIEADINDTVVIQCTGSSRTNKNLNISWYRNVTLLSSEWVSRDINGRIVSNLTLERVDRDMFGVYKCTLTYGNCSTAANTTLTPPGVLCLLLSKDSKAGVVVISN